MAELLGKMGISWNSLPLLLFCLTALTAIVYSVAILNLGEKKGTGNKTVIYKRNSNHSLP